MGGQILRAPPWTAAEVRSAAAAVYSQVAISPSEKFRFPVGPTLAHQLDYPEDLVQSLPPTAIESLTGVASSVLAAHLASAKRVLDLGSGVGRDARIVATEVVGVAFSRGNAETLPGNTFDAVLVNGLLNLTPNKSMVIQEIYRVLRSGGRGVVAEIVADGTPPPVSMKNFEGWLRGLAGALSEPVALAFFAESGFASVTVHPSTPNRHTTTPGT